MSMIVLYFKCMLLILLFVKEIENKLKLYEK